MIGLKFHIPSSSSSLGPSKISSGEWTATGYLDMHQQFYSTILIVQQQTFTDCTSLSGYSYDLCYMLILHKKYSQVTYRILCLMWLGTFQCLLSWNLEYLSSGALVCQLDMKNIILLIANLSQIHEWQQLMIYEWLQSANFIGIW